MGLDSNVETIKAREAASTALTDGAEDISGGVTAGMGTEGGDASTATLYLSAEGALDVSIEFSPDGGATWYEPAAESPIEFNAAGDDVAFIEYDATHIKATGSDGTPVDLDLRVTA